MKNSIDIVITWVDGSDERWLSEKYKYDTKNKNDSNSSIRYRDWGLLKYWFRSIEQNAPWINHIYLITCGHYPMWLNLENAKLTLIKHSDYIPQKYLPTFNSNVIELYMHRIKNLSDKFIYFNDDMFLIDKVSPSDFFKDDLPLDSLIFNAVSVGKENNIIEHTILNNLEIISKYFDKNDNKLSKIFNFTYGKNNIRNILLYPWKQYTGIYNFHSCIPYNKKLIEEIWTLEGDTLETMMSNKFRTKNDYNHWIYRYWSLMSGKFVPHSMKDRYYYDLKNDNKEFFNKLKNKKYKIVCLNDSNENINFDYVKKETIECFEYLFPNKSSFEKSNI